MFRMLVILSFLTSAHAAHHRIFILTGQSNSLGTTNGSESDTSPGTDPADQHIRFFWHNVADPSTSIGDSSNTFTTLQSQQGGHYPGNPTHWGPEIDFARTLARAGAGHITLIKASRGGGGNTHWSKSANGHMYQHLLSTITSATNHLTASGDTFEISGLLYLQGESDSPAEAEIAGTRIKELTDNLRADLPNASNLHTVIAGIAAPGSTRDIVRTRHAAIAGETPYITFFPNLDLQSSVTDGLHFNKSAKLLIGRRFATTFLSNNTLSRHYGRLTFIGDSITQGGNGDHPSYRYHVFKHLANASVPQNPNAGYLFTGSVTGPQTTPLLTTPDVNGQSFQNIHEGHYGWRASWINARIPLPANRRSLNRGEGTLLNWTNQANPQTYQISGPSSTVPYPDPSASGTGNTGTTYTPDTACLMIGINDLGDAPSSSTQLLTEISLLIDQLQSANPAVRIFLCQLLHTNQTQAMRDAVNTVNAQLPALASSKSTATSPIWIAETNEAFDPASLTYDNVHPNTAGEIHVADRIATALGIIPSPPAPTTFPPPHQERLSEIFNSRFEGNEIWNGSTLVNSWTQTSTLTRSLPSPTDLRLIHPSTDGRWIEGTTAGWNSIAPASWTFEARIKPNAIPNGFVLWLGTGSRRILVEIHPDRTQNTGATSFSSTHNNIDGNFHTFRIIHDAPNSRYHVFRNLQRLTPINGAPYDQTASDSRLIIGDYTSATFGNAFDFTLDHVRFTTGTFLPPGIDSDSNGLPDAWEYQYFSTLTGTSPSADPDEDGIDNLTEFNQATNPIVADQSSSTLRFPAFLFTGGGNAHGITESDSSLTPPLGSHPADRSATILHHNGSTWSSLSSLPNPGPEIAFARLLWDAGIRTFGIVKSTRPSGGNSLWLENAPARQALITAALAASTPPPGFDETSFPLLISIQGESNDSTEANTADTRFSDLLENLRATLPNAASMKAILGEIGGTTTDHATTRTRHRSLANSRADIGIALATGLTTHNNDGLAIHYTTHSLSLLGARIAAESLAMNLHPSRPLPAWENLHAWFIADHATLPDSNQAITRWASLHDGSASRDLSRRVSGQLFRNTVTAHNHPRQVMNFDGTNDLWSNASTEFGTITGPRSVAILCRLTNSSDGFLFDGTTNTGRTRAQVRAGSWQTGVTPPGSSIAWNLAEPQTTPTSNGWQRHIFTYTPASSTTTIQHWVNGSLAATTSENESTTLGGLILGSNGGSPFSRLPVEIAEVAVFNKTLTPSEISTLDSNWSATWGTPTGPPFSVTTTQSPREIPRFGKHVVLEIPITTPSSGITTLTSASLNLITSHPQAVETWSIHSGADFNPSSTPLSEITGNPSTWTPDLTLPLSEGTTRLFLTANPSRSAPLGATIDASLTSITTTGSPSGTSTPTSPDPPGHLTLALVPMFTDVVRSGNLGINTFRIPGIATDRDGTLHAVYDHRYNDSGDLPGNIDVGYSRSTDGGTTWSTTTPILDFDSSIPNSSGNGVGDPAILYDPNTHTLWTAALWSFGNRAYNGSGPGLLPTETAQYVLTKSTDAGLTWSPPINITAQIKDPAWRLLFCGPGHGITLRDGTLVFPSQMRREDGLVRMCFIFSRDQGTTWKFGSVIPETTPQTNENELLELDDGRLLFSARTPSGSNGQRAWSHFTPATPAPETDPLTSGSWSTIFRLPSVPDPVCQASVIHWKSTLNGHPREWILFANPATGGRNGMTLRLSQDGGLSWPVSRLLYPDSSAYSCLTTLPDGSIGLLFERDNYTKITFARVEEAWLLNHDLDSDNDGIPDAWETLHNLNPNDPSDALLDTDSDSSPNRTEFLAGTDPANPSSLLEITRFLPNLSENHHELRFSSIPGRSYTLESSTDLLTWTPTLTLIATLPETTVEIPTPSPQTTRFHRITTHP